MRKLCVSGRHLSTNFESNVRLKWMSMSITACPNPFSLENHINTSGEAITWLFRRCGILGILTSRSSVIAMCHLSLFIRLIKSERTAPAEMLSWHGAAGTGVSVITNMKIKGLGREEMGPDQERTS
ncbi:hypothetical protein PIB30_098498 [Stylosanthes scabra]|uniref:Uncharacterized protein n=1 Tax=Stylosanthes scabra TaxID=79078 RepID=A0ABU6UWV1_9FABA|nr:hypothetical protein [Stylosanthes scabra]